MSVDNKMSFILNDVFRHYPPVYKVVICNKYHYEVFYNGELMLETKSTKDIYSHWMDFVRDIVMVIINERIKLSLNEV